MSDPYFARRRAYYTRLLDVMRPADFVIVPNMSCVQAFRHLAQTRKIVVAAVRQKDLSYTCYVLRHPARLIPELSDKALRRVGTKGLRDQYADRIRQARRTGGREEAKKYMPW